VEGRECKDDEGIAKAREDKKEREMACCDIK
jgi:hypothetical protein